MDLGFNCLHITICDNIGFVHKANHNPSKIGTLQTTQIIDIIITEEQLISEGILDRHGDILLSSAQSNRHVDLLEEEGVAERLVSVSQDAIDSLTQCVAEAMMTATSDCLKGNFAVGKRRLRSARFISLQTKGELLCDTNLQDMHPEDVDALVSSEAIQTRNTLHHQYYHQPNMTCQIIHNDLAKLSTIKLIADYMVSVQNKHRADWTEEIERRRTAINI
jgi:hypothetical protein